MSAYEPASHSDGSIDPLGLQADAARLADLLLPGFTVRMDRARALTIATAIVQLAKQLAPERQLPYRICLERLFLDSLVANAESTTDPQVRGFPGRLKAKNAQSRREPLTVERYVKGPATNGLVGVYATLARIGRLFDDDAGVLPRGDDLLVAWERDVGQVGLATRAGGDTNELRRCIERIARKDLAHRQFDPSAARSSVFDAARFDQMGKGERSVLATAMDEDLAGPQRAVLERLRIALPRYRAWTGGEAGTDTAERIGRGGFERSVLADWTSLDDGDDARAIATVARFAMTYERTSQLLTAVFDSFRWVAAQAVGNSISFDDVLADARARAILLFVVDALPSVLKELEIRRVALATNGPSPRSWKSKPADISSSTNRLVEAFVHVRAPLKLLESVTERHRRVQKSKRKGDWMIVEGARYRLAAPYQLVAEAPPAPTPDFLHAFRLVNALSILSDLEG